MTATRRPDEQRTVGRERPRRGRDFLLRRQGAGQGQHGHDVGEAAEQHREAQRRVEPEGIAVQAGEGRAVVGVGRSVGVDDLGEAVRAAVAQTVERGLEQHRRAREPEHHKRIDEHRQHRELHLAHLDLLAEVLGRAADHQPGDKDRDDGNDEKAVKSSADAAWPNAAGQKVEHRDEPGERRQRVEHRVDRAGAGAARRRGEQNRHRLAEANLLALEIACRGVHAERRQNRVSCSLRPVGDTDRRRGEKRPSPPESHAPGACRRPRGRRRERRRRGSAGAPRSRAHWSRRWDSRTDAPNWR